MVKMESQDSHILVPYLSKKEQTVIVICQQYFAHGTSVVAVSSLFRLLMWLMHNSDIVILLCNPVVVVVSSFIRCDKMRLSARSAEQTKLL